jgi:hypothetical protein
MNQLINATIEVVEMSDKAGKFGPIKKIKGKNIETGQTNTYTVYKSKQDGTDSAAWGQLGSINVLDTVSIGYAEQPGKMPDGTPFTSRIIRNFDKDIGEGRKNYTQANPAPQAQSTPQRANIAPSGVSRDEFSRRLGIQGHLNALLSNPNITPVLPYPHIIDLAIGLEDSLESKLNPSPVRKAVERTNPQFFKQENLQIIQDDPTDGELNPMVNDEPEMNVEDTPF